MYHLAKVFAYVVVTEGCFFSGMDRHIYFGNVLIMLLEICCDCHHYHWCTTTSGADISTGIVIDGVMTTECSHSRRSRTVHDIHN